jgi:16S rRNA (cytosine967-C5)-methyltransferase
MDIEVLSLASMIIAKSSRESPADAMLREELRSHRGLPPGAASQVSHAVFSYYRWFAWLEKSGPVLAGLKRALQLADRFAKAAETFSDSELMAKAVPGWIQNEMEVSPAWVRSLQSEPGLWLRARPGQGSSLAAELGECERFGTGQFGDTLRYFGKEDLFRTSAFHAGRFEIHDLSSQAVGLVCSPRAGEFWWDACAGEGGKTMHLSDLMENKGLIWASDRAAWRLLRLKRRAARARVFNYRTAVWSGSAKLPTKTKFDGVLLDAPCTGIGTWQRNPHARWTTTPEDVTELSALQKQLVNNAAAGVKIGGRLFYVVCTLTRAETVAVIKWFEKDHPEFERLKLFNPLRQDGDSDHELWLWPQEHPGSNGMFAAGWVKR